MEHNTKDYDYIFKIVLLGDTGVGKSCFIIRYTENHFPDHPLSTIGVDFKFKKITSVDTNKTISLQIWDRASGERYPTVPASYYRGAHGIILFVDLTDRSCFEHLIDQVNAIKRYALETTKLLLAGSKGDDIEHRKISYEEIKQFADKEGFPYIETSAKENKNIDEAVTMIATAIERDPLVIEPAEQKNSNPTLGNTNKSRRKPERCLTISIAKACTSIGSVLSFWIAEGDISMSTVFTKTNAMTNA